MEQIRRVVEDLFKLIPERPFATRLADGSVIRPHPEDLEPVFTLVLKRPAALRRMFLPPSELAMGEAYIFDDFDIEGDSVAAFRFLDGLKFRRPSFVEAIRLAWQLLKLERQNSAMSPTIEDPSGRLAAYREEGQLHHPERDKRAIQFHYDMSNDFFRLWLDERMVYSCAYFDQAGEGLDVAQENKLDRICQKLKLHPGERLLDIGCGWGGLIIHAAANYGVQAEGITLSEAQAREARARIQALGLGDRCRVTICHYENYQSDVPLDKVVSVGMFEHVGEEKLGGYFAKAHDVLAPGGLFLLQGGASRADRRHAGRGWMEWLGLGRNAFMQKYSFPDSRLLDLPTVLAAAEMSGFETLDVESLREHYALTNRHWLENLEANRAAIVAEAGEAAYRAWRLVLSGFAYLLEQGYLSEYKTLLAKR